VALAIAQVMVREGLVTRPAPFVGGLLLIQDARTSAAVATAGENAAARSLEPYAPEKTAERTGIAAEKIIGIARQFANAKSPLAIGGGSGIIGEHQGTLAQHSMNQMKAIHYLNHLVGNVDKERGVRFSGSSGPLDHFRSKPANEWLPLSPSVISGPEVSALLIHNANPVYSTPKTHTALALIPLIVSFSSFMDETTQLADLILPDNSFLESWNIKAAISPNAGRVFSLSRPVVELEFQTRQTADVLLALGREMGGAGEAFPFASSEEIVKQALIRARESGGAGAKVEPEEAWSAAVERGFVETETGAGAPVETSPERIRDPRAWVSLVASVEGEYQEGEREDLILLLYEHAALGLGEMANLPWLQELPDPMTSVMWGSWIEINPRTAASMGISDGDLVEVQTSEGVVRLPAVLYPAIRPDVVAMPCGQGHAAMGRYAKGRGVNPAALLPTITDADVISVGVRAKISRVGGTAPLARFGTSLPERVETKR
jgi:anaerobic selenocysteine-containing dehydrogenase